MFEKEDLFIEQLRAILRASAYGNVQIMFPMITSLNEVKRARDTLERVKRGLKEDKIPFNVNIPVGVMIETPAAVMISGELGSRFFQHRNQ